MKTQLKGMAEKSLQVAPANKRAQFAKDLDKLISGDYVLVPKEPTQKNVECRSYHYEQRQRFRCSFSN